MPSLTAPKADDWIDRGEPPEPTLVRILVHYFDRHDPADQPWLTAHAVAIRGLVEAGGTEIHVVGYLYRALREIAMPAPPRGRVTSVPLWHATKAAQVRDTAARMLRGEASHPGPAPEPLAHWLAARLLTPDELEAFERGDDATPYADEA